MQEQRQRKANWSSSGYEHFLSSLHYEIKSLNGEITRSKQIQRKEQKDDSDDQKIGQDPNQPQKIQPAPKYRNLGRLKPFWKSGTHPLKARIYLGPDYGYFLGLICFVVIFTIFYLAFTPSRPLFFWVGLLLSCFLLTVYLVTALKDPGLPAEYFERINRSQSGQGTQQDSSFCQICLVNKSSRTVHCDSCEVCIEGFDHHCPWVSKCVGKGNYIWFLLFVISIGVWLVYTILTFAVLAQAVYK